MFNLIEIPSKIILKTLKYWSDIVCLLKRKFDPKNRRIIYSKIYSSVSKEIRGQKQEIIHKSSNGEKVIMKLGIPSDECKMRADTFSTKEPEILDWIDDLGSVTLWDIGANIGLYSIYHALKNKSEVISFEPSVFNLPELIRNINTNKVESLVTVLPMPLSNLTGKNTFLLESDIDGAAGNAFGVDYGYDGKSLISNFEYETIGFAADYLTSQNLIEKLPNAIKLDVDGIEHLILSGMKSILSSPQCRHIFIESSLQFDEQSSSIRKILIEHGFLLKSNHQSSTFSDSSTSNQIWCKN